MATTAPSLPELPAIPISQAPARSAIPVYCAVFLGYLMLLPPQLGVMIGGAAIPLYRFFLIASALYILASAIRGKFQFAWPDIMIVGATSWICVAMSVTSTADEAFTASVAHIADVGFAYFFARAAINDLRDLRLFLILMLPGLLAVGIVIVAEAVLHRHIIQGFVSQMTGREFNYGSSPRMGLMRAQGPFMHPILAGIFLASFLPLYWLAGFKWWVRLGGVVAALCSIFTVSSAALLALAAATGMLVYNWLTERFANVTWTLFFIFAVLFVFWLEFGTNGGAFSVLVRFASLNSESSYARIVIFEYGSQNVADNPWFGLGYGDWKRPEWLGSSVDNHWLVIAMRFGLPAVILTALAILLAVTALSRRSGKSLGSNSRCERGVAIALGVFALGLISVSVWLSAQVWFFMLAGIAVSLANSRGAVRGFVLPSPAMSSPPVIAKEGGEIGAAE